MRPEIIPEKARAGILILSSSFPKTPESFEGNFIFELVRRLDNKVIRPIVLAPHFPEGMYEEQWSSVRICRFRYFFPTHFEQLAYGSGIVYNLRKNPLLLITVPFFFISEFFAALRIIHNNPISIIHTHWLIPQGIIGAILHKISGMPHIATVHGSDLVFFSEHPLLHPICRFIMNNSDRVTVNSTYTRKKLIHIFPDTSEKVFIIPMGVDLDRIIDRSHDTILRQYSPKKIILTVGRLIDLKGTIYLIEAMPEILKKIPDVLLIIIGAGPESQKLEQRISELGVQEQVIMAGLIERDRLPLYYHAADVFVLPSLDLDGRTEGLGVVLLEAMAVGCPVIGSNVGGIPDIIADGENGFLVPSRDSLILAEKIIEIVSNRSLADKFRYNGKISIKEKFSWDIIVQNFFSIYKDTIKSWEDRRGLP